MKIGGNEEELWAVLRPVRAALLSMVTSAAYGEGTYGSRSGASGIVQAIGFRDVANLSLVR